MEQRHQSAYIIFVGRDTYAVDLITQEKFFRGGLEIAEPFFIGCVFGTGGSGWERLNAACPRSMLEEAMQRLLALCAGGRTQENRD